MLRLLLGFALLSLAPFVQADEYDTLRAKWKDIIIGSGYDTLDPDVASRLTSIANSANTNWNSMIKTSGRASLWSDLASTTNSAHVTSTYIRLWGMAQAYATPGWLCLLSRKAGSQIAQHDDFDVWVAKG